jgi:hypothetical protein
LTLFDADDEAGEPVAEAAPAALPRLPDARRAWAVGWLRARLAVVRAFRHEDNPLAGPVLYADAVRVVQGRRDLAGFDPEYIAEAFRGPV